MKAAFDFVKPKIWSGRYSRIMGNESVFHLKRMGGELWPVIVWVKDDLELTCVAVESDAVRQLSRAVAQGKKFLGGSGAGSFQINEYGQVIVPASDGGGERAVVGEYRGPLLFENPDCERRKDRVIDLSETSGLSTGEPWTRPYIGTRYQLHRSSKIYFYRQDGTGAYSEYPPVQDDGLIEALRKIRPYGPVRLVVNMHGVVLTKVGPKSGYQSEDDWQPVYVGKINPKLWFEKES